MRVRGSERGFTLLELLMVVIIIAILASIALPQYLRVTERSRTGQVIQLLASIRGSELRFRARDPGNLYDNSGGLGLLDVAPLPVMPAGWNGPTVTGTGAGSNVQTVRNAGVNNTAWLGIDLDTGNMCANNAAAGGDWGVATGPC